MNEKIRKIISEHEEDSFFTNVSPSDEMISAAQEKLGVVLPDQYVEYLKTYGHGGVGGVEILGFGFDDSAMFVDDTLEYRGFGLPDNLVVVENVDEWLYCLDCDTGAVVSWNEADGLRAEYPDFDEFILDEFNDAIDNL
ncbi:MAG: SMI1/KNR4 family protein [Coriobacteriales bacterium]|jgi:hypothetical protein